MCMYVRVHARMCVCVCVCVLLLQLGAFTCVAATDTAVWVGCSSGQVVQLHAVLMKPVRRFSYQFMPRHRLQPLVGTTRLPSAHVVQSVFFVFVYWFCCVCVAHPGCLRTATRVACCSRPQPAFPPTCAVLLVSQQLCVVCPPPLPPWLVHACTCVLRRPLCD